MTTSMTQEVASLSVAQMYQEGLRLTALAAQVADGLPESGDHHFDEENAHNAAAVSAYATAAQACFAGVQTAAFATMAMEASSDLANNDEEIDEGVAATVFQSWLKVFAASGGQ